MADEKDAGPLTHPRAQSQLKSQVVDVIPSQQEVVAVLFAGLLDCQTRAHAVKSAFACRAH